ncbi:MULTISPECIES: glycosyltransferase [unclassified Spirosoma]|uniref:glycosyltransferase n=1 Tax=unclassified Spirosoma TaxID=2621999 RepID=UPI0009690B42|nr:MULTISPECIES: glycosyltransferase [unclassified Spirosoma]MBN8820607.1 glycosyltransferase [Spirosoma sp.]OJW71731.1 MAG: glycosyl transferase family 2 [Spirosoma sp. 48-14]
MTAFLLICSGLYALFTVTLWVVWLRMPIRDDTMYRSDGPMISVIVPVRNEADSIFQLLTDLNQQSYRQFEVIIADDASTDNTAAIVQSYTKTATYPLRLLLLKDERTASPKKRAIAQSISLAEGKLIVTTDGDCRVAKNWLAAIADFYGKTGARLISGPVTFTSERSVFDAVQTVEFASLIGTGACTMAIKFPTMCNGANLCYEKDAFTEVGGFVGVDHLASGDDEFLMHKIAVQFPDGVQFLKSAEAIVRTKSHRTIRGFYNQRRRWASKWRAYQSYWPSALAVFIFLSNAAPVIGIAGWLGNYWSGAVTLLMVGLKVIPEFVFLLQVLVFLQKRKMVVAIPFTQLIYPFYVLFFGLAAQSTGYTWKGRRLK